MPEQSDRNNITNEYLAYCFREDGKLKHSLEATETQLENVIICFYCFHYGKRELLQLFSPIIEASHANHTLQLQRYYLIFFFPGRSTGR